MLGGKYKVLGVMGRGSNGVTYRVIFSARQCPEQRMSIPATGCAVECIQDTLRTEDMLMKARGWS